ncbi:MAG: hypothetical protein OXG78_01790 [Chloroflexi bacterium]|nr:hypothetical protein [Chloroflexota bacterium]
MATHRRSVWEDLLEAGRRMLKELDDLFDSKAQQNRKPARVPVPVPKRRERYENE